MGDQRKTIHDTKIRWKRYVNEYLTSIKGSKMPGTILFKMFGELFMLET